MHDDESLPRQRAATPPAHPAVQAPGDGTDASSAGPAAGAADGRAAGAAEPSARPAAEAGPPSEPAPWAARLAVAALLLAAVNLRPAVTSLGALLKQVRGGLGMSGTMAGLLTSVPGVCFALFGFAAPRLARRFGPGAVVCAGMAAVTAGLALRPLSGATPEFLAASALALAGIAVTNVLMPVVVKRYFPHRIGTMTGLYSMALAVGTAAAAAVTVPLSHALGGSWRLGLGVWAALAAVAVLPWIPLARDRAAAPAANPPGAPAAGPAPRGGAALTRSITRSPTAWMLGCFFGLQSTAAYVTMGWSPQIYQDAGISAGRAGLLLAFTMALSVPLSFVLPPLAARMRSQGPIAVVLAAFQVAGFVGLWAAPAAAPWLWALLLGVANCAFPLVLTMIGMRSRTGAGVVRLSAFAQSTGYLISIPGPILVGTLNQATGGWALPMGLMAALALPQAAAGVLAGRNRHVEDEL